MKWSISLSFSCSMGATRPASPSQHCYHLPRIARLMSRGLLVKSPRFRISSRPQVFPFSMTAWQLTTGPERQFTCGPRVPWKERLRRVCEGTPPGFSFLLLFFPFFVRALILSPLSRVMGNVYVFSRIKVTSSGAFWLCFSTFDCQALSPR